MKLVYREIINANDSYYIIVFFFLIQVYENHINNGISNKPAKLIIKTNLNLGM